jgi:hypothetical protein
VPPSPPWHNSVARVLHVMIWPFNTLRARCVVLPYTTPSSYFLFHSKPPPRQGSSLQHQAVVALRKGGEEAGGLGRSCLLGGGEAHMRRSFTVRPSRACLSRDSDLLRRTQPRRRRPHHHTATTSATSTSATHLRARCPWAVSSCPPPAPPSVSANTHDDVRPVLHFSH